ncbi:MAG: metallophosphoesterase [Deltaproteobacteria bacterium]|nr:metallophosphoesterase [Deltaproteobacteria bacterium]
MTAAHLRATVPQSPAALAGIQLRRFAGPSAFVEQLDHLRIAHLTDLHVGRVTPLRVQHAAVDLTNAQTPDLVVITGDFVCHSTKYLDELTELISRLVAKAPVMCVMGNHDYWSGAEEVRWALRRAGAEILDNANTVFSVRHQRLQVVGLDDAYTGHASRARALAGLRRDLPTIGLSHIAEEADALWRHGVSLVLAGHTHAGQVTVARLHEISIGKIGGHKYVHGMYGSRRQDDPGTGAVYVGAGIGAAVIPFRVGERGKREVTIFELGHQPGSFAEHHDDQDGLPGRKPSPRKQWLRAAAVVRKENARRSRTTLVPPKR